MGRQIVQDDDVARLESRSQFSLDVVSKMRRSIGASMTKGAVRASHRRPAMKVCVFQCPNGTFESSLCPFRLRPRRRAILVVVPVSSRKTSRCGSSRMIGWRVKVHSSRACSMSGRSCSPARRVFFEAIADADEPP